MYERFPALDSPDHPNVGLIDRCRRFAHHYLAGALDVLRFVMIGLVYLPIIVLLIIIGILDEAT